ncbi:MAG: diguanylate cyclase [Anaeromyxobacter sp.]|nr:diguanylate cyclase [Anaeromyxobacter sp.]MBL0275317.1 diguanylate cyclase [Anaeromyxobacter sp.]
MAGRILVAVESKPVVSALRRDLEPAGFGMDAVAPSDAAARLDTARHVAAVVRAAPGADVVVAALKAVDPHLTVLALFFDEEEAEGHPGALGADGVLVGPLTAPQVAGTCALAARLTVAQRRAAVVERARPVTPSADQDLGFLKRLIFTEVKRSKRYGIPLSLALVSVDQWDAVAGQLGAGARAALLGELTGLVAGAVRDIDIAVPFSEERLVVLMPHTPSAGGLHVSRRLCARVRERSTSFPVTVSVGVASHEGQGTVSFGSLVKRAAEALASARADGGDRASGAEPPKRRDRISIG